MGRVPLEQNRAEQNPAQLNCMHEGPARDRHIREELQPAIRLARARKQPRDACPLSIRFAS